MKARVHLCAASGPDVGLGHLARTRAVYLALVARGVETRFWTHDTTGTHWLATRNVPARVMGADAAWAAEPASGAWLDGALDWSAELDQLSNAGTPVALVENRGPARARARWVVYPTLHWRPDDWDTQNTSRVRAGAEWIPFAPEITQQVVHDRDVDLLVTFGGSDPTKLTERALDALVALEYAGHVAIALGVHMRGRAAQIESRAAAMPNAEVFDGDDGLAGWMARARLALTSVGTTLYELAYLGVPALVLGRSTDDCDPLDVYATRGPHLALGIAPFLSDQELTVRISRGLELPHERLQIPDLGDGARRIADLLAGS